MCNLYSQTRNIEAIRRLFKVSHNRTTALEPQPAIFPGWSGSVVRKAEDGKRELVTMSWGFVLLPPGKAPRRVTNVRDDKILTSRFWTPSFEQRRRLGPAVRGECRHPPKVAKEFVAADKRASKRTSAKRRGKKKA